MKIFQPIALFMLFTVAAAAQQSLFDTFEDTDLIKVTLKTNFDQLINDKSNEEYQPATFEYEDAEGNNVVYEIKVKQRGKYRRRICEMPPLKLDFDKDELRANGLSKQDEMKLVTHCIDDPSSKETIVKEYLAYKLYNQLTPYSLRVQLVKITYEDTTNKNKIKQFGFLIEDIDELADRLDGKEIEPVNIDKKLLHARQEALAACFNYMIGNADWDTPTLRNVKLIDTQDSLGVLVIPYDFDFAGIVNAPYAVPNGNLGLTSIKQRAFMGLHEEAALLAPIKRFFDAKQEELYETIKACKHLSRIAKSDMIEYLDTFYQPELGEQELFHAFK